MSDMEIVNKVELDDFLNRLRRCDHPATAIKGKPPEGMTYSDGTPLRGKINVAWQNSVTGEMCNIVYRKPL